MPRRHKEEEHENHERWLVSYADFITLLFAFFVVMYAISQVNEGKYRVLSNSLEKAFQNNENGGGNNIIVVDPNAKVPATATAGKPQIIVTATPKETPQAKAAKEKMSGLAGNLENVLKPLVDEGQVKVNQTARGIAVEINASVLFAPADAKLNPGSMKALGAVADLLVNENNAIQIEGHTDNLPIKSTQYPSNWELSSARASSVVRLFIDRGISPARLSAIGYGENRPLSNNTSEEGRSRNRRVQVTILAETPEQAASMPAF
ncbi:flagellar motor protein MotD [Leeia sp. TBRC 13508]|uniref:Flagellar motor protein MotD n=1 Tax=Leeia speluncae TaxID=2884804 RepID=A0ABS8D1Q7_9NEIS|nr:flagellar motor protein MotD [Leeia speluncae]MCB6182121.1 flagellar motor protein MotD [Leeia speluncae]